MSFFIDEESEKHPTQPNFATVNEICNALREAIKPFRGKAHIIDLQTALIQTHTEIIFRFLYKNPKLMEEFKKIDFDSL